MHAYKLSTAPPTPLPQITTVQLEWTPPLDQWVNFLRGETCCPLMKGLDGAHIFHIGRPQLDEEISIPPSPGGPILVRTEAFVHSAQPIRGFFPK